MALTRGWGQNSAMTALDARMFTAGLLQKNADNSVRYGQLWGSLSAVSSTSSMNVSISASYWAVGRGLSDGAVVLSNDGSETVTLPSAPQSNSQYSVVWVKQDDNTQGDADSTPVFGVTAGNPSASPQVPAAPAGALALATVLVPAGVTATNSSGVVIKNVYKFAAESGTPIRYRNVSEMVSDAPNVVSGSSAYVKDGGTYYLRTGTWNRIDTTNFAVVTQTTATSLNSATSTITLGGTTVSGWQSSDTQYFPTRTDSVVQVSVTGWYEVTARVLWSSNQSGERFIEITNGDTSMSPPAADRRPAAATNVGSSTSNSSTGQMFQAITTPMYCQAGDYIKLKGWQNSGSSISYNSSLLVKLLAV